LKRGWGPRRGGRRRDWGDDFARGSSLRTGGLNKTEGGRMRSTGEKAPAKRGKASMLRKKKFKERLNPDKREKKTSSKKKKHPQGKRFLKSLRKKKRI